MGRANPTLIKKHPRISLFHSIPPDSVTKPGRVSVLQLNKHPTQLFQKCNKK